MKYFDNSPRGLSGTAYAHTAIAYIYNRQKDYKTALHYYKALHFKENIKELNDSQKSDLADCYLNIGNIYLELTEQSRVPLQNLKFLMFPTFIKTAKL